MSNAHHGRLTSVVPTDHQLVVFILYDHPVALYDLCRCDFSRYDDAVAVCGHAGRSHCDLSFAFCEISLDVISRVPAVAFLVVGAIIRATP